MQRNEALALSLLDVIEEVATISGISYQDLRLEYERRQYLWADAESYLLELLVGGGYVSMNEGMPPMPTSLQLTWNGHDLLDSLRLKHR